MTEEFSHRTRAAALERMSREAFDVLVVGGGIVGAGIARDAATRGLATALVERDDFASGTSGATSRLIHGGLRYLKDLRIRLVREAIRERDRLVRVAPALVRPIRFVIPVYAGRAPGAWSLRAGLFLYDALSREKSLPRRRWLSPEEVLAAEPALAREGLRGGGEYSDAIADDACLVLAVVRDAAQAGAVVANHAEAVELFVADGRVAGARVRDRIGGGTSDVRSRVVVNATGVWADRLRRVGGPRTVRPTKGVHVLVPRDRIGNVAGIALTAARDRRVMFVLPWGELCLVGTTDTDFAGDPDLVAPDADGVDYLLESVNAAFPRARLKRDDVVGAYAGLRPLVRSGDDRTKESDISREHELLEDPDGLLTVVGGKLTTHRGMAEEVIDRVCERLRRPLPCATRERPLGPPPSARAEFLAWGTDGETAAWLGSRYSPGQLRPFWEGPGARDPIGGAAGALWVEVDAAVHSGMAMTLADVLARRLRVLHEAWDQGVSVGPAVAARIGRLLGWDAERIAAEIHAYEERAKAHRGFREGAHG